MPLELYAPGGEATWLRSFSWSTPVRPRFYETDALGHVNNVYYTAYVEIARLDFLGRLDDPQGASPFGFLHNAVEITLRFVRPCFYNEALEIHTRIATLGTSSMVFEHAITPRGSLDIRTVARVTVVHVQDGLSCPWSDAQRSLLAPPA